MFPKLEWFETNIPPRHEVLWEKIAKQQKIVEQERMKLQNLLTELEEARRIENFQSFY